MQTPLLSRHAETAVPVRVPEKRGAVYTKPWIIELISDMAGYDACGDLAAKFAVEPAAGDGEVRREPLRRRRLAESMDEPPRASDTFLQHSRWCCLAAAQNLSGRLRLNRYARTR
jgi:hypothetical protein